MSGGADERSEIGQTCFDERAVAHDAILEGQRESIAAIPDVFARKLMNRAIGANDLDRIAVDRDLDDELAAGIAGIDDKPENDRSPARAKAVRKSPRSGGAASVITRGPSPLSPCLCNGICAEMAPSLVIKPASIA